MPGVTSGISCGAGRAGPIGRGSRRAPRLHRVEVAMRLPLIQFCCAAALTSLSVQAQDPVPLLQPGAAFKSRVSLVALTVTVQDARARYVTGLQPADFAVYEDGVRQDVQFVEADLLPVDLIVLLDGSRSMEGKVETVRAAAQLFLDTLRPGDRGAVVAFNDRVRVVQPLTEDREALTAALRSAGASGNTALHNALYIALKQFAAAPGPRGAVRRQAIAVLSDGEDTASLVSFDDVLALARTTGINIYTVRLRAPGDSGRQTFAGVPQFFAEAEFAMKTLARETGALAFAPTLDQLRRVYASIAEDIASQYSIGYQPSSATRAIGFHRISVQVVTRPELRTRTRAGYLDDRVPAAAPEAR
jgi:Ca-activated chloride channel homolog